MDTPDAPRLLDRVRDRIRLKHYSIRTEQAYSDWIKRFIRFHGKRHPAELGATEVEIFLTHLAVERSVSASTQNQAKSALLFLYREVLGVELPWLDGVEKAKAPTRLPVVLTPDEVSRVLTRLQGTHRLIGRLLYGTGLRIMEALRLRIKDVEFSRREILVRDGKGGKDRVTMLPRGLAAPLRRHVAAVETQHQADLKDGFGSVWLPQALARKHPAAGRDWGWQYVFPAGHRSIDPRSHVERRHHVSDQAFNERCTRESATRVRQARDAAHAQAFFCYAPTGSRLRHPHRARVVGAPRRQYDDDLYPRPEPRRARCVISPLDRL